MQIEMDTSGIEDVLREEPGRVSNWLDGVAEQVVGDIQVSYGTSPPGRSYRRGTITHVASQPGYPPNVDTNALRGSIHWDPDGPLRRIVSDGMDYGIYLEDVLNRPHFGPVFMDWERKIEDDAGRNLRLD
jgi:hypothetical protein